MSNTIVPASQMLKKKDFRPLNKWHRLNTNYWIFDFGLIRKWNDESGNGDYYVTDKSLKHGWDLVLYMDGEGRKVFLSHYDLPQDLPQFLKWCYNHVAATDEWKRNSNDGEYQMSFFPYESLYNDWKKTIAQGNNVSELSFNETF